MCQQGSTWEHEQLLNNWLGNIAHYQECVATYEASKHAFFLGNHTSAMYRQVLEVGGRLHKQFAILLFHLCAKHTQTQLPPHAIRFFEVIAPLIDSWIMGLQENGTPFSTNIAESTQEYVLGVKVEAFASHVINRVYTQTYHRASITHRTSNNHVFRP